MEKKKARAIRALSYPADPTMAHFPQTPASPSALIRSVWPSVPPSPHHRRSIPSPLMELPSVLVVDATGVPERSSLPATITPMHSSRELPPSPPPSPVTHASPTPPQGSADSPFRGQSPLPTTESNRPATTSSTHLSLASSSEYSTRFSSLFFAPLSSSPPQHGPLSEETAHVRDSFEGAKGLPR